MGSDNRWKTQLCGLEIFQSTLPAGGATFSSLCMFHVAVISIHAPRRGSDTSVYYRQLYRDISIPAPRRGSDDADINSIIARYEFQSTLPAGGATFDFVQSLKEGSISIHAPRRGSDMIPRLLVSSQSNFNPRSPQGERQYSQSIQQ